MKKLKKISADPLFSIFEEYKTDKRKNKINLGVGLYLDDKKNSYVLPCVRSASGRINIKDFNYDSIAGNAEFLSAFEDYIFEGNGKRKLVLQQTCGGTHALSLTAFALKEMGIEKLIITEPTWPNHYKIFSDFKLSKIKHLKNNFEVNYSGLVRAIEKAPKNTALLLHGGMTHNPTGKNFFLEQILDLKKIINEKEMVIVLDYAYLGFTDDISAEKEGIVEMFQAFDNLFCAVSFSKNATLYKQRLGVLIAKTNQNETLKQNLQAYVRRTVSNPPGFGAEVMADVLKNNPKKWERDLLKVRKSIEKRRKLLAKKMGKKFQYIELDKGFFSLLPFTKKQIDMLKKEHGIYLAPNGRISFGGLATKDIARLAKIFNKIMKK